LISFAAAAAYFVWRGFNKKLFRVGRRERCK
jgi:hypothetical protein